MNLCFVSLSKSSTSLLMMIAAITVIAASNTNPVAAERPNILIAVSDDQSWQHTSFAGYPAISTPAFDRIAREGVYFRNGFAPSPGCSPCRAAFLTGRHTWQIEEAGTHASSFPSKYITFPDLLEQNGYCIGLTGKGWSPGNFKVDGRNRNPAGPTFSQRSNAPPYKGMSRNDYAANFADFLAQKPSDQPFCFWFGATEPHRGFEKGSGIKSGKKPADATVPGFLPDHPEIRSDLLDYCVEIEWFDTHLGRMIQLLEQANELENTLIIVTSDNGMAFPRAKANLYDHGFHVPLAIRWGKQVPAGRIVDDVVSLVDLTATIFDATEVTHNSKEFPVSGNSILNLLKSDRQGTVEPQRKAVYSARERHSSSRYMNWTYPQRAIRTQDYLLIRNFRPERWPAGDPRQLKPDGTLAPPHSGYTDIDPCPSLDVLIAGADDPQIAPFLQLAVAKRPAIELFHIPTDPDCLNNLAEHPEHQQARGQLAEELERHLRETGDPRVIDGGEIWETYPRYSRIRSFPPPGE